MKIKIEREHIGNAMIPDKKNGNSLGITTIKVSSIKSKGEMCDLIDMDGNHFKNIFRNSVNLFKKK